MVASFPSWGVAWADPGRWPVKRTTTTKKTGMMSTARTVAEAMPPATAQPMAFWPPEPAPLARASGKTPRMKAMEVIRMGRSRMRAAARVASTRSMPASYWASANSTMRMAFLAERPMVVSRPTWK